MSIRKRFSHPCNECFVLLSHQYGISQSTPIGRGPRMFCSLQPIRDLTIHPFRGGPRMFCSPLQQIRDLTIHPFRGPRPHWRTWPVSSYNTICNSLSPLLTDIVRFALLCIVISLTVFKTSLLWRGFYTLINNVSFSFPTNVGSHIRDLSKDFFFILRKLNVYII